MTTLPQVRKVAGNGKPGFPGEMAIPSAKVDIVRVGDYCIYMTLLDPWWVVSEIKIAT
jgi:hypothetical protein